MRISAVIPTIGRVETLPTVITALGFQSQHIDEIILLDEAAIPICESYAVNQALDVLSCSGVQVKILRSRRKEGIGAARVRLAREARNPWVLMVDDDVVLRPTAVERMISALENTPCPWAVPTCFLVHAGLELDGYTDRIVDRDSPEVIKWVGKYPWFLPYFMFNTALVEEMTCAGTQAILLNREMFLERASQIELMGNLPREDTYMTTVMGTGILVSSAVCLHYEHPSQISRGDWGSSMFYRVHEVIIQDPEGFMSLFRKGGRDGNGK